MFATVGQLRGPYLSGVSDVFIVIDTEQYFQLCVRSDPTAEIGGVPIFVSVVGSFPCWP